MSRWADYIITGVRYDSRREKILRFEVRQDYDSGLGAPRIWSPARVLRALKKGSTFKTSYKGTRPSWETVWKQGAALEVRKEGGQTVFDTAPDGSCDKGELPNLPQI